jgi:hypothetical protein
MSNRDLQVVRAKSGAQSGRCIPLNQHYIRIRIDEHWREKLERAGKDVGWRLPNGHNFQIEVGTDAKSGQSRSTHVLVLTGVNDGESK